MTVLDSDDLSPTSSGRASPATPAEPAVQDVVLYWSGGKDCAMVLHDLHSGQGEGRLRVNALLTTFTAGYDRVSGHGVRRELIELQADAIGIPLHRTYIPQRATMDQYESVMESALLLHKRAGTLVAASGDVFVEKQRVSIFKRMGFRGCFPLWKRTTLEQVQAFLAAGFKARVVCVDSAFLDQSFVGRDLDEDFLARLPPGVDPCGENGEYHTFVYDGPILRQPLRHRLGEVVFRESLYFCDVLPDV